MSKKVKAVNKTGDSAFGELPGVSKAALQSEHLFLEGRSSKGRSSRFINDLHPKFIPVAAAIVVVAICRSISKPLGGIAFVAMINSV